MIFFPFYKEGRSFNLGLKFDFTCAMLYFHEFTKKNSYILDIFQEFPTERKMMPIWCIDLLLNCSQCKCTCDSTHLDLVSFIINYVKAKTIRKKIDCIYTWQKKDWLYLHLAKKRFIVFTLLWKHLTHNSHLLPTRRFGIQSPYLWLHATYLCSYMPPIDQQKKKKKKHCIYI